MKKRRDEEFHWHQESQNLLADCQIFSVYRALRVSPDGKRAERFFLDSPDWVTVIPLIEEGGREYCLMVRQYRQGSRSVTIEFPAGMIDSGESPEEAVKRELLEETGYSAGEFLLLGRVNPNPAIMANSQYIYLARGLSQGAKPSLDEHEDLDCDILPLEDVSRLMGTGSFHNGTMMSALGFLLRWRGQN